MRSSWLSFEPVYLFEATGVSDKAVEGQLPRKTNAPVLSMPCSSLMTCCGGIVSFFWPGKTCFYSAERTSQNLAPVKSTRLAQGPLEMLPQRHGRVELTNLVTTLC